MKVSKRDHKKYFKEKGDIGFNPARNKKIVNDSIKRFELLEKNKSKDYLDKLHERTNAVAWYLTSKKAQSGYGLEKYFTKRTLAQLRGQQIVDRIKTMGDPFTKQDIINKVNINHAKKKAERTKKA